VRIVKRQELMAMPAGTVYSLGEPMAFSGLFVKGDNVGNDFAMCSLLDDFGEDDTDVHEIVDKLRRGDDVPLQFGELYGREGMFDDEQCYAVWSSDDVEGLAKFLMSTVAYPWPKVVEELCEENLKLTASEANACSRETMREKERDAAVNGASLTVRTIVLALGGQPSEETNLVWILKRIEELRG
jgi:hypothetical protein